MNEDIAQKFINSVVKNLQVLCHSNVDFQKNVEVIGHLYLNVDSCTKLNYIVNEKVCKNEASSTVFVSNSFHAELGLKKKDKEPSSKSVDEVAQRLQRSHAQNEFTRRNSNSNETSSNNVKRDREIQGHNFHTVSKMRRLSSEPTELRHSSSISPSAKSKHSQDSPASLSNIKVPVIEVDLAKVKKEFMGGGGCSEDGVDNEESSACRSNTETDITSIDFSTAFPISLHQSQNLSSALNIPDISGSGNSNNIHSAASPLDQKPFVHNSNIEPPQFPPMVAGGSPRLRPPWLGDHSTASSAASSNFPDMYRFAKRSRTVFSQFQLQTLEEVFQISPYLSALQKRELSRTLDMSMETLSKWFQNRRQRPKKSDIEKLKRSEIGHSSELFLESNITPHKDISGQDSDNSDDYSALKDKAQTQTTSHESSETNNESTSP